MEIGVAGDRILPVPHRRGDPPLDRPERRRCRGQRVAPIDVSSTSTQARLQALEQRAEQAEGVFRGGECGKRAGVVVGAADAARGAVVPPPMARALTSAGSRSIALARLGSSAALAPRSLIAVCSAVDLAGQRFGRRAVTGVLGLSASWLAYSAATSPRAFHAAPTPISTGSDATAHTAAMTGRAEIVIRRTTPVVRSATTMV